MEISITKMSENGQIVIPSEIRKDAKIGKATKFIVMNRGGDIWLKQLHKEELSKELMEKIDRSEDQIKKGQYTKADTKMSVKEMHKLLMK